MNEKRILNSYEDFNQEKIDKEIISSASSKSSNLLNYIINNVKLKNKIKNFTKNYKRILNVKNEEEATNFDDEIDLKASYPIYIANFTGMIEDFITVTIFPKSRYQKILNIDSFKEKPYYNTLTCWAINKDCKWVSHDMVKVVVKILDSLEILEVDFEPYVHLSSKSTWAVSEYINATIFRVQNTSIPFRINLESISVTNRWIAIDILFTILAAALIFFLLFFIYKKSEEDVVDYTKSVKMKLGVFRLQNKMRIKRMRKTALNSEFKNYIKNGLNKKKEK